MNILRASIILGIIITTFFLGCATSPEQLAMQNRALEDMRKLEGRWVFYSRNGTVNPSLCEGHYDFKVEHNQIRRFWTADQDCPDFNRLKGDSNSTGSFSLNGRRIEGVSEMGTSMYGIINEDFNEINFRWVPPHCVGGCSTMIDIYRRY